MSPFFISQNRKRMITDKQIKVALDRILDKDKYFIVRIHNKADNIKVILDGYQKFGLEDCININKQLKNEFMEELDDYNLEVTSPGLTSAFEVPEQYKKHIGEKVEVLMEDGQKVTGKLLSFSPGEIEVEEKRRMKNEKNKKKTVTEIKNIKLDNIKRTKLIISF